LVHTLIRVIVILVIHLRLGHGIELRLHDRGSHGARRDHIISHIIHIVVVVVAVAAAVIVVVSVVVVVATVATIASVVTVFISIVIIALVVVIVVVGLVVHVATVASTVALVHTRLATFIIFVVVVVVIFIALVVVVVVVVTSSILVVSLLVVIVIVATIISVRATLIISSILHVVAAIHASLLRALGGGISSGRLVIEDVVVLLELGEDLETELFILDLALVLRDDLDEQLLLRFRGIADVSLDNIVTKAVTDEFDNRFFVIHQVAEGFNEDWDLQGKALFDDVGGELLL